MAHRPWRAALALVVGLLALVPSVPPARAALRAGTAGACPDVTGVTVVVDQRAFGGAVEVRCAAQPVRSGFEALTKAGFTYAGTVQFPGLLCRIDGQPASDPCQGAPPPSAYWGYWHAERGGSWTYSSAGASRTPPPGSVEGWAFGDDARPGTAPPAPAPPPTSTTRPAPPGGAAPPPTDDAAPPLPSGSPSATPTPTTTEAPGAPASTTTAPVGSAAAGPGEVAAAGDDLGASRPSAPEGTSSTGTPVAVLVTGGLLAVAAGLVVRQQRARRDG